MNVHDLVKADELFFIDIETVGGIGICQIGITKWNRQEQRLSVVFNEIINPDVPPEEINIHALKVHGISEYSWSNSQPYKSFHPRIRQLLDGKIVLQWGGADISIINKNIVRYKLESLKIRPLNCWLYHFKGIKLTTAAEKMGISYTGNHRAASDSYLTALIFVSDLCGYKITNIDRKIIDSFNSQVSVRTERFKIGKMQNNGSGDEVCLTGFTSVEKEKFSKLLAGKGFRVRSNVSTGLRYLITPSGAYSRSPVKEDGARRNGAEVIDLNSLLQRV